MRKSKKILGRRLSIVPSSCAWASCWFWIVMLHRSLGVLAATPFQVLIANCQTSDLHQSFNKVSNSNLHRFMTVSYIWIQLWLWKTHAAAHFFRLPDASISQKFCHVLLLLFGYFCRWRFFFFTFISGFFGATNWRIWCCFEESIAVEERDLVGRNWGFNGKWYDFCRFVWIFAESMPKMEEICILWFPRPWFVKSATLKYAPICFSHWWILRRGEISWLMKFYFLRCSFSFKVQSAELFFKNKQQNLIKFPQKKSIRLGKFSGFWSDWKLPPSIGDFKETLATPCC